MIENNKDKNKSWDISTLKRCDKNGDISNNVVFMIWNRKDSGVEEQYLELDESEANLLIKNIAESLLRVREPLQSFILEEDYDDWEKGTLLYYFEKPQDMECVVGEINESGNFKNFKKISYRDIYSNNIIPDFL